MTIQKNCVGKPLWEIPVFSYFIPSVSFGSGLPAFPEIGFTGDLPTIWDSKMQSLVFSMPQIRYIQAAHEGVKAAQAAVGSGR